MTALPFQQIFLQLEGGEALLCREVIGIFDAETAMRSQTTKQTLLQAQQDRRLCNVANDLPQSLVLVQEAYSDRWYLSGLSVQTLKKRWNG